VQAEKSGCSRRPYRLEGVTNEAISQ
jgi:hypothetical protein